MLPDADNDAQAPNEAQLLPDASEEAASSPLPGSRTRSCGPATLAGCIFLEALTLLVLVAFCSTVVGVSFLVQAMRPSPETATPAVAALITPEPAPAETETPAPLAPTAVPATPTATPTRTATPTVTATVTPTDTPTAAPRRYAVFIPFVVRAPSP